MRKRFSGAVAAAALCTTFGFALQMMPVVAQETKNAPKQADEDGRWRTEDGNPSYNIKDDGTLDWYTFSGYRRYHSECHVCHGPEGEGSSYAPALVQSLKTLTYEQFQEVVVNGKKNVETGSANQVMPALGDNLNVMCYLDDIYSYLKARSDGVLKRGRPEKREDKPAAAKAAEDACFGRS